MAAERTPFSLSLSLALYYAALFFTIGLLLPYWPVWLASRGLGPVEIGTVLAFGPWLRMTAPLAAALADRRGERRRVLRALTLLTALAFALFALAHDIWTIAAISILTGLFFAPVMPIGDNLAMMTTHRRGLDFGRVRLWGSLAFILSAYLGGLAFTGRAPDLILLAIVGGFGLTFVATLGLPQAQPVAERSAGGMKTLLADRVFVVFLLAASLNIAAHAVLYVSATLHWRASGLSGTAIGLLWAEGVIAEIIVFATSRRAIERLGAKGPALFLMSAGLAGMVRWLILGWTAEIAPLALAQALHGFTFAAAHLGTLNFIIRRAPPSASATAQALHAGFGGGLAMGLGMLAAGYLYDAFAGHAFWAMIAPSALTAVLAATLARGAGHDRQKEKRIAHM